MAEIVIIADDLTGAADTGVQFCSCFLHPILVSYRDLSGGFGSVAPEALSVYTSTRSMKAESAQKRAHLVASQLLSFHPRVVFKKVDSCLRGNIGAEVDGIMDAMGFQLSFIAPAFPEMNRLTLHDVHCLDGTPIAETELSRDPVNPVTESRLSRVVAAQSRHPVGHVDANFLEGDDDLMGGEIARLVDSGARHVVFDVSCRAHLDRIARFALGSSEGVLMAGSAGLAGSMRARLGRQEIREEEEVIPIKGRHHLVVCGTPYEQTRLQVLKLRETYPYRLISITPDQLVDSAYQDELLLKLSLAKRLLADNNLIVTINTSEKGEARLSAAKWPYEPEQIVKGLGWFTASIVKETPPASLFVSGGDTASAVLAAVGARGIELWKEVLPGVAMGRLLGSVSRGLPVVTKAGAFGCRETLVALHEYWLKQEREKADGC